MRPPTSRITADRVTLALLVRALNRVVSICFVMALAVSGCAPEEQAARPGMSGTQVTTTVPVESIPQGDVTTSTMSGPGAPPRSGRTTSTLAAVTPRPGQVAPRDAPVAPGRDPVAAAAVGPPGSLARALLQPAPAERDVLEVLQQPGATPQQATVARAVGALRHASGKSVSLAGPVALAGGARQWTPEAIREVADGSGRASQGGEQAVVRFLFLEGSFAPDNRALGAAVRGDVVAVFPSVIRSSSSPVVPAARIEEAVAMHELGHILGLVDLVIDRNRDDPDHPGHSTNPESVMYWAVESSLVGQVLGGPPPTEFDAADRADLSAIRNGA